VVSRCFLADSEVLTIYAPVLNIHGNLLFPSHQEQVVKPRFLRF
jgi:hypothetical protein